MVIEGEQSQYKSIHAGVPQGSILGSLLFIVYVNDAIADITSHICLFTDDTSLYLIVEEPEGAVKVLNHDLHKLDTWSKKWIVKFSIPKTKSILLSRKDIPVPPPLLSLGATQIDEVTTHKHQDYTSKKMETVQTP